MFTFGAGVLIATPTHDATGAAIAIPSPVQFGILQEVDIDQEFEEKLLYGANQFPVDMGRGKGKFSIKAKFANINAELFNSVFYGTSLNTGYAAVYQDLSGTIIPGTAAIPDYTVLVTPPSSSLFARDLGVQDGNGVPFTKVASAATPTGGQYTLTAATGATGSQGYLFSDIDAAAAVRAFINYEYTNATSPTAARNTTVTNLPMGYVPFFSVDFQAQKNGKTVYYRFPRVSSSKLSSAYKNDDYTIPEFDMQAIADSNNVVCYQYESE